MNRRRRHRSSGPKRPESTTSIVIAGISFVSAVTCFLFISMAIRSKGNTANILGGTGVLFLLAGIGCIIMGAQRAKDANFSLWSRLLGVITPVLATGMWLYIYLMGLLYG